MRAVAKKFPQHAGSPALLALGDAFRHYRMQASLSQEALALAADIDRSYLGGVERDEHNVAMVNLLKLASTLEISLATPMKKAGL